MTARPLFVKLAAFFFAFAAAVALVALFTPAPPRRVVVLRPRPQFVLAENLESQVELVSLDREAGRSYARLKLRLVGGSLPPERLWMRIYFFNPSDRWRRVWADDAVELVRPFDRGDTAPVTVSAPCTWCEAPDVPASGFFARVEVHEDREALTLRVPPPLGSPFGDIREAVPVAVHADGVPRPRR